MMAERGHSGLSPYFSSPSFTISLYALKLFSTFLFQKLQGKTITIGLKPNIQAMETVIL
ncbi:MAG: hypothetical protein QXQ61_02550 [Candidatus Bathyarchaeia archaeon]